MGDDHYGCEPENHEAGDPRRYPASHVRFSPLLAPLGWLDRAGRAVGAHPLAMTSALLREYDRAAPHDRVLGSEEELRRLRDLAARGYRGLDESPFLSPVGRFLLRQMGTSLLRARASVLRFHHEHRAFIEENGRVEAPIIITGVPRSGTTLLHRLLSEDPATRSARTFELENPLPPLRTGDDPMKDPRIAKSGGAHALMSRLAPGMVEKLNESHLWSATEMEECFLYMMGHNGLLSMNAQQAGLEYCLGFLAHEDKRPVFRYERVFLSTLDAYRPAESHWTLKAPNYAPCFPLVFEEYPDARVIVTHRNPLVTLPSLCRLMESWSIPFERDGTFDKHRFGGFMRTWEKACLMTPLRHRETHPEHDARVFDCMYQDLFRDPIGMVRRVYDHFDLELTSEAERRMRAYLEDNRQGKYGRHRYSLEEYGFEAAALHEDFRPYMERYGFDIPDRIERPVAMPI